MDELQDEMHGCHGDQDEQHDLLVKPIAFENEGEHRILEESADPLVVEFKSSSSHHIN